MYVAFYFSAMISSLLASLCVAAIAWRHRGFNGAKTLQVLVTATFIWTLGYLLEAVSTTLERQLFFNNIGWAGAMTVPAAWLIFALRYTRYHVTFKHAFALLIVPAVTVVLVWTNQWHHLMWSNEHLEMSGSLTVTGKTYGPMFWAGIMYNYVVTLAGTFLLVRRLFVGTPLFFGQALSLAVAAGLPVVWNVVFVFDIGNLPRKDLTPAMFAFSGLALALGVMRFRLLAAVPFARKFIVEQMRDGVFAFDTVGRLLEANPAALRITGAGKGIIGKELVDIQAISPVFAFLSPFKNGRVEIPLTVSRENRFYELETIFMQDGHGGNKGWLAVLHEVTERKQMQRQVIMQDRLASIGQIVSGVAHELNNPLTSVVGFSELLLKRDLPADVKEELQIVNEEARRTADIVSNLLLFARGEGQKKELVDMNAIVQSVLKLRSRTQSVTNIRIKTSYELSLPSVLGNSSQLQQVLFNLVINAEQSMFESHKKGLLTITSKRTGDFIRISVADDGPGISKENMSRLFSPFFTTKDVGKGTGLGLSICHGIAVEHGGKIWAESEEGKGAVFFVELPLFRPASSPCKN